MTDIDVQVLDHDDHAALTRFVAAEHALGSTESIEQRRAAAAWSLDYRLLLATRSGQVAGTCVAARQIIDGGHKVFLIPKLAGPDADVVRAFTVELTAWEVARRAPLVVPNLRNPTDAERAPWIEAGYRPHGARQQWSRGIDDPATHAQPAIRGVTFALLADHPELELSAHTAWCDAYARIPDMTGVAAAPSLEAWRRELRGDVADGGADRPLPVHLAVDDTGRVLGVACIGWPSTSGGTAIHRMTGVVADARGRGIARALKETQLIWAAGRFERIRCSNHEQNAAMLHINEQIGYVRGDRIEMLSIAL
ncbi:MAG: GNAT family N-acetyltransferase [Thermoleophilia bacterium]|nr:GNAT family N-acetyltransferase [Thermoleophilia bacterium]